jgi:hypothetical protein
MPTSSDLAKFLNLATKSTERTKSGSFFRLGQDGFRAWTEQEIKIGVVNGVEYVDTEEAKTGDGKSFYTDCVSSCCALAARRVAFGPPREPGAMRQVLFAKTFLAHVVGSWNAGKVAKMLLRFQPNLNPAIEFYMFTMPVHLQNGQDGQDVGYSGAVEGLLQAYGRGSLESIARRTTIVTGYQGVAWDAENCGVHVRPHGVFPVSRLAAAESVMRLFPGQFEEGWAN